MDEKTASNSWQCLQCSMVNNEHLSYCEACRSLQPTKPDNLHSYPSQNKGNDTNSWQCKLCSMINNEFMEQCEECLTKRESQENKKNVYANSQNEVNATLSRVDQLFTEIEKEREKEREALKRNNTTKWSMIFLSILIVLIGITIFLWKMYYINKEFETHMMCYRFITFSDDHYQCPYNYNNIIFKASVIGIEGLELKSGKNELNNILKEYKCDNQTRTEVLNLSYDKYTKSSLNIDRSKKEEIEVFYLRIFVSKMGDDDNKINKYLTYCGVVHAVYNFPYSITDDDIRCIIEKDAAPRFKKDLSKPNWSHIVKKKI